MSNIKSGLRIPKNYNIKMSLGAGQHSDLYSAVASGGGVVGTASHTDPFVCQTKVLESLGSNFTAMFAGRRAGRNSEIDKLEHANEIEQQQIKNESLDI